MSDWCWIFIPEDAGRQPTPAAAEAAAEFMRETCPEAHEVTFTFPDQMEIVHPYQSWEGAKCPACKTELEDALFAAMDAVMESGDVSCTTPCCGLKTTWHDLDFPGPAGFARFYLEVMNPRQYGLQPFNAVALTEILGMPLRQVWRHI